MPLRFALFYQSNHRPALGALADDKKHKDETYMKNYSRTEGALRAFRYAGRKPLRKTLYKKGKKYVEIPAYFRTPPQRFTNNHEDVGSKSTLRSFDVGNAGRRLPVEHDPCISRSCLDKVCPLVALFDGGAA
jgi:hypothetical protein